MTRLTFALGISLLAVPATAQQAGLSFSNTPLSIVLNQYAEWTGKKVEIVRGVDVALTVQAEHNLTRADAAGWIADELRKQNVGLFEITSNRLVAVWIDPSKAPPPSERMSFADRVKKRREQMQLRRQEGEPAKSTDAEKKQLLEEFQMDVIRAKGAKGPPLPIPLTKEQDDQLVKEGALPPIGEDADVKGIQRNDGRDSTNRAAAARGPSPQ